MIGERVVGKDDVISAIAGEHLGVQRFIAIEIVVDDLDAGLALELLDGVRSDIVRPVVDVHLAIGAERRTCQQHRRGEAAGQHGFDMRTHFDSPCLKRGLFSVGQCDTWAASSSMDPFGPMP